MDNDLTQGTTYRSSRGPVEVRMMVTVHARRSLEKLVREHGWSVVDTMLGRALVDRAKLDGHVTTEVDSFLPGAKTLRGSDGRFSGIYVPREHRP